MPDSQAWWQRISTAQSPDEVVALVREYFATRDPDHLALLPGECRPTSSFSPQDIADCAYRLAAYHSDDEDVSRLMQRIGSVLSRASIRLAELAQR